MFIHAAFCVGAVPVQSVCTCNIRYTLPHCDPFTFAIEDFSLARPRFSPISLFTSAARPVLSAVPTIALLMASQAHAEEAAYDEEVIVTSSRIEMPLSKVATSVTVIDSEALQLKGYNNLFDVLRTVSGVAVSNSGGAGKDTSLRIRGEEGYRTLMLIDGVDVSDPSGTQISPRVQHLLSTVDIERVEILRGPQGFMYGADAGGVVNIITRSGQEGLSAGLTGEAGSFNTQRLGGHIAGGNGIVDASLSVSDFRTDGFNTRSDDTEFADNDGAENTTVHLKTGWNITSALRADVTYRDINANYDYDNCFGTLGHDCLGQTNQNNLRVNLRYDSEHLGHQVSYAKTEVERISTTDVSLPSASSFDSEGKISEIEYVGSVKLNETQTLIWGADFEQDEMVTSFGNDGERDQLGLFSEYQVDLSDAWFVTAGVRHDDNEDFGRNNSWRVSSAYVQPLSDQAAMKYRGSYGTGFRAPSLYEISYNAGPFASGDALNFAPSQETSEGYEVGVDYTRDNGTLVQLTYFNQRIEDEIFFDLVNFSGYLQAEGESQSRGVELSLDIPLTDQLRLQSNYTYNDTEQADGSVRVRRPRHIGNVGLNWQLMDSKLQLLTNVRMSRDSVDNGELALEDYAVVDVSASFALRDNLKLTARIENLLDENYQEVTNYNTAGTNAYVGIRYQL